jgi:hypothetical protein
MDSKTLERLGIIIQKTSKGRLKIFLDGKIQKLNCVLLGTSVGLQNKFEAAEISPAGKFLYLTYKGIQYSFWIVFQGTRKLVEEPLPDLYE